MTNTSILSSSGINVAVLSKYLATIVIGMSLGLMAAFYSPLIVSIVTFLFTVGTLSLYTSTYYYLEKSNTIPVTAFGENSKNGILFYLFYFAFFLSITIPKSGKTFANIPITVANLAIALALVYWCLRVFFLQKEFSRIPLFKTLMLFILYGVAAALIGVVNTNHVKYIVLDFVAFIGFIPVYFLVCSVLKTQKQLKRIISAIVLSLLIVSAYGALQKKIGFSTVAVPGLTEQYNLIIYEGVGRWNVIEGGGQKLYSTFQNGNIFGNHLALFIPLFAGIVLGTRSPRKKVLFFGIFLFSCYILFFTYSRGALVGTISGLFALSLISKKIRMKAILVIILICGILGIIFWQYADRSEMTRYDIRRISSDPNRFSAGRLERFQQVLAGFAQLPFSAKLFGLGLGGELISPLGWRFMYVDNLYLTLLYKIGLVGMFFLFVILFQLFSTLLKYCRQIEDMQYRSLLYGGIAGLVASLVHNLADTLWFFPPLSANFWFVAGIMVCVGQIGTQPHETPLPQESPKPRLKQFHQTLGMR